jgi:hypothetical protein
MEKRLNLNPTAHCFEIGLFCYGNPSYSSNFHNRAGAKKQKKGIKKKKRPNSSSTFFAPKI